MNNNNSLCLCTFVLKLYCGASWCAPLILNYAGEILGDEIFFITSRRISLLA